MVKIGTTSGQLDILVSLWVRLTCDQTYPLVETTHGHVSYYFGQADLWSDVLPSRDILCPSVVLSCKELGVQILYFFSFDVQPLEMQVIHCNAEELKFGMFYQGYFYSVDISS